MISKKQFLIYSILIVFLAWSPWIPWETIRKVLDPWNSILTIVATAISPLIAIQITKILDEKKQEQNEKMQIFKTLMEFRSARLLSPEYSRALSLIDVAFGGNSSSEVAIKDALAKHIATLTTAQANNSEQANTLYDLLYLISEYLNLKISRQAISSNGIYPKWIETQITSSLNNNYLLAEAFKNSLTKASPSSENHQG